MRDRWYRKGSKNKYDPKIGEAALANTRLAERSEDWNQKYFEEFVKPSMALLAEDTKTNSERQGKLFDLEYSQAQLADKRYRELGIPAEDRYYKMVDEYSAPEEQERQARGALGDVRTAAAGQAGQLSRKLAGLGINPTSPAALAASSDQAMQNAATEAAAATRAREGAKALGMQLTSDAANFGRGGASGILQFGAGAGGASSAGQGGSTNAAGVAPGGASGMNTAFGTSGRAYGSNLDAMVSRANTVDQTRGPSALSQIGGLIGQGAAAYLGGPAGASLFKPGGK